MTVSGVYVLITHNLTHCLREGWSRRSAGDGSSVAGGFVGCGVPGKVFGVVCVPHFWVNWSFIVWGFLACVVKAYMYISCIKTVYDFIIFYSSI